MSTSVDLSCFPIFVFRLQLLSYFVFLRVVLYSTEQGNLQRTENKGIGNENILNITIGETIFQKYFLLISNSL